jgi:LacI family transcriptional regulator
LQLNIFKAISYTCYLSQKRTTLKDIAERLDISITTVNRALKDHPDISKNLKEKV